MKKTRRTLCYVIILILLITTIQGLFWVKLDGVYKGMSYNNFCESRDYYQYGQYLFFRNQLGDHCVAYLSEKKKLPKSNVITNGRSILPIRRSLKLVMG